jgi:Flp pilus assembly pilin Flp
MTRLAAIPRHRQRGATATEYLIVVLALLGALQTLPMFVAAVKVAFDRFSWALMLPF